MVMSTTPPNDEAGADRFFDSIMKGNRSWTARYSRPPFNGSARAVVLTCMDSRIPPLEMLGLAPGEVFIIRNAGNSLTRDALRSLLICLTVMECRNVLVVGHSGCGMRRSGTVDKRLAGIDTKALSGVLGESVDDVVSWLGFYERQESDWAEEQAAFLRRIIAEVMPGTEVDVRSAIYHLEDGRLEMLGQPSQKITMRT